jgi:predicted nucleic acid-binding protein
MHRLAVGFDSINEEAALAAGRAFNEYRARGGRRDRVVADFLIGAHAGARADRLLSRDRGIYSTYFKSLALLDPSTMG